MALFGVNVGNIHGCVEVRVGGYFEKVKINAIVPPLSWFMSLLLGFCCGFFVIVGYRPTCRVHVDERPVRPRCYSTTSSCQSLSESEDVSKWERCSLGTAALWVHCQRGGMSAQPTDQEARLSDREGQTQSG